MQCPFHWKVSAHSIFFAKRERLFLASLCVRSGTARNARCMMHEQLIATTGKSPPMQIVLIPVEIRTTSGRADARAAADQTGELTRTESTARRKRYETSLRVHILCISFDLVKNENSLHYICYYSSVFFHFWSFCWFSSENISRCLYILIQLIRVVIE